MNALVSTENTKEGTQCVFLLPTHYTVPPRLSRANADECVVAFQIADQVLSCQEKLCLEEYQSSITKDIMRQQHETVERLLQKHRREMEILENSTLENEKWLKKQIAELEVQLQRASTSQESIRTQFLEEAERRVEQQKESDNRLLQHVTTDLERTREQVKELEAKLQAKIAIQQNSSRKGREGEETFEELVRDRKGWTLTYSGDQGHAGDYHMRLYNLEQRFEVKNYTHTVPKKEVEKFYSDLRNHPETDIGVFISFHTAIVSIPIITCEWTPKNQLIVFVPHFLQYGIDNVLQFLDIVFQVVKPYRTMLATNANDEQYPMMKKKVDDTLVIARNATSRIADMRSNLKKDVKALEEKIKSLDVNTSANIAAIEDFLNSMIYVLCGQHDTNDMSDNTEMIPESNEGKKTKRTRRKVVNAT